MRWEETKKKMMKNNLIKMSFSLRMKEISLLTLGCRNLRKVKKFSNRLREDWLTGKINKVVLAI